MLFAFVIVLFAGLAFMFLCLLRGQEKVVKTVREELAATRARIEALERRLGPSDASGSPVAPDSLDLFGSSGSLNPPAAPPCNPAGVPADRPEAPLALLTAGMTRPATSDGADGLGDTLPRVDGSALPAPENLPCAEQGEATPRAETQGRADDAASPLPDRLDMNRGEAGRPELDRLEMEPPSTPYLQGEARRARAAGLPDLKL